jgi:hypothetical protein
MHHFWLPVRAAPAAYSISSPSLELQTSASRGPDLLQVAGRRLKPAVPHVA